jgi:protein TonB
VVVQAAFAILVLFLAQRLHVATSEEWQTSSADRLIFVASAGPGGGGGAGGGDHTATPPRPTATPPPKPAPTPVPKPKEPEPMPTLEGVSIAALPTLLMGTLDSTLPTIDTRGPGDGNGANGIKGPGDGPGKGNGLGDGQEKGFGGGSFRPGNGVSTPKLLNAVRPNYTAEAMRARISGSVWLECVVEPTGTVDRCKLSRSLDANLGLDQEALKAAQKWTFEPGKRAGEAVPVQVTIELAFSLR